MTAEEYYTMHQKAFRCAFDFLNAHFPPGADSAWWEQAANDVSAASGKQGDNELAKQLLTSVYLYLENEWKRRNTNEAGH